MDAIVESFLAEQSTEANQLAADSDILELKAMDAAPSQYYMARFRAKGLVRSPAGDIVEAQGVDVGIHLPDDYLRHAEVAHVLTYLGPHRTPWHPNIQPPFICVHVLPGMSLVDLLYACYETWTWRLYGTGDEGLNHAATQWARQQDPARFPVDRRPLKRRKLTIDLEPVEGRPQ